MTTKSDIHIKSARENEERLMELKSLFEISKTLSANLNLKTILNNILLTPMGRMMITKGAVLLKEKYELVLKSSKGISSEYLDCGFVFKGNPSEPIVKDLGKFGDGLWEDFIEENKLSICIPIVTGNDLVGILLYGKKLSGKDYSETEIDFLNSLSNISGTAINNTKMFEEIRLVNAKLDKSNQSLNTLFDIGNELNSNLNEEKILKLVGFALMGHMMINKFAVILKKENEYKLKAQKGFKGLEEVINDNEELYKIFEELKTGYVVNHDSDDKLDVFMKDNLITLLIPMKIQEVVKGVIFFRDRINDVLYTEEDLEFLATLANQAMISLENARLFNVALEKQRIEEELAVATDIQNRLLPKNTPDYSKLDIDAMNVASKFVGGDYYDYLKIDEKTLGIVIADVSGKGVPASLLMSNLQASMRSLADLVDDPSMLTSKVNDIIYENTGADKFITFFYCRFNNETRELYYCNAGHNYPIVISKSGEMKYLDQGGLILGMIPNVNYKKGFIQLEEGDAVVLYTDGISEALNEEEEEFEEPALYEVCTKNRHLDAKSLKEKILEAVYKHTDGYPQSDDITLVVLKVK